MKTIILDANWTLEFTDPVRHQKYCIPAQVPGNVIGDLHRAGLVGDPYFGHNCDELRPYEYTDWHYRTTFRLPKNTAPDETLELEFGGIDTVAQATLNGHPLGSSRNMFIARKFILPRGVLRHDDDNELRVDITSAINAARAFAYPPQVAALAYNFESLYLRKARHSFGWDIAPRLVGAGLWRPVELHSVPARRWEYSYLHTTGLRLGHADMALHWQFRLPENEPFDDLWARLTMRCGSQCFSTNFTPRFCAGLHSFQLPDPQLWWPMGSGKQPIYECELILKRNDDLLAVHKFNCGVRTVKLDRTESVDRHGNGRFHFIVNGQPIFIHGSNHVPDVALHGEERGRAIRNLAMWSDLNCNMIRIWGGGVYEEDGFYDECDRRGILVWQDFMIGCECPPMTDDFLRQVADEATAVIRRLRQHPSLALWAGDNECDIALGWWGGGDKRLLPSYNRVTREVLPRAVAQEDPYRDYLPSSPYVTDELWADGVGDAHSPEQHLWGPRNFWKSDYYRNHRAVFASEMGYHGMPSIESMKKFLPPDAVALHHDHRDWFCHCTQPFSLPDGAYSYRLELMYNLVRNGFGEQSTLEDFVDASQFVQAEGLKFMIESFRMRKPQRSGLIWWNVIDCWPQFSDAIVDYYGEKKAAYDYVKCSQQDTLLCCAEPVETPTCRIFAIRAVNDRMAPVDGSFKITAADGKTLLQGTFSLPANSPATTVGQMQIPNGCPQHQLLLLRWEIDGKKHGNHYVCGNAPYDLQQYRAWHRLIIANQAQ